MSTEDSFRPTTAQAESPGPLGHQDSASPDNKRVPPSTPGTTGISDSHGWEDNTERLNLIRTMDKLLEEMKFLREDIFSEQRHVDNIDFLTSHSGPSTAEKIQKEAPNSLEKVIRQAVVKHCQLFQRFCFLLESYLYNFHDFRDQRTTAELIGLVTEGPEDFKLLNITTLDQHHAKVVVGKLAILACERACQAYKDKPTVENLKRLLLQAVDTQVAIEHAGMQFPGDFQREINRLVKEACDRDERGREMFQAVRTWIQIFIKALPDFLKDVFAPFLS